MFRENRKINDGECIFIRLETRLDLFTIQHHIGQDRKKANTMPDAALLTACFHNMKEVISMQAFAFMELRKKRNIR